MNVDTARRLELTDLVDTGRAVEGRYGDVKVRLDEAGLMLAVEKPVPWKWIHAAGAEPNSPDVVVREPYAILAQPGSAPAVEAVFQNAELHAAMAQLFAAHPLATFEEGALRVPDPPEPVMLKAAVALVRRLREAVAVTPMRSERAPVLPKGGPWYRDPWVRANVIPTAAAGVGVTAIYGTWIAAWAYLPKDEAITVSIIASVAWMGAMLAVMGRRT